MKGRITMKTQITPSYTTIGDIFEKNFLFEVPKYQRYYSWESEQVDDFIKDIKNIYLHTTPENIIEHFFWRYCCSQQTCTWFKSFSKRTYRWSAKNYNYPLIGNSFDT